MRSIRHICVCVFIEHSQLFTGFSHHPPSDKMKIVNKNTCIRIEYSVHLPMENTLCGKQTSPFLCRAMNSLTVGQICLVHGKLSIGEVVLCFVRENHFETNIMQIVRCFIRSETILNNDD